MPFIMDAIGGGGSGSSGSLALTMSGASWIFEGAGAITIDPVAASDPGAFSFPNAISVDIIGAAATIDNLVISAVSATTIDLSTLTITDNLTLVCGNPTLTNPVSVGGVLAFSSTTKTTLVIPEAPTSVVITAANMVTITASAVILASCLTFTCTVAKLNLATVDSLLADLNTAGNPVVVDISGGTSATPTKDVPATAGTGEIVCPSGASLANGAVAADWVKPAWKTTEHYYWFSDGSTTDPAPGGTGFPVAFTMPDSADDIATALAAVMDANGYAAGSAADTVSYTLDTTGSGDTAGSNSGPFTNQNEVDGADAYNSDAAGIVANGGTVTTN